MPDLIIVAGPNGSGKSTVNPAIAEQFEITPYDWDKSYNNKWSKIDYDSNDAITQSIRDNTNQEFEDLYSQALSLNKSFAFETNFHSESIITLINDFRNYGYRCILFLIFVDKVETCIDRVSHRVKYHNGHNVIPKIIRERFILGRNLIMENSHLFDEVLVYDHSREYYLNLVFEFKNRQCDNVNNKLLKNKKYEFLYELYIKLLNQPND